jgi:hypothetical protein
MIEEAKTYQYICTQCGFTLNYPEKQFVEHYYCEDCLRKIAATKDQCQYSFWKKNKKGMKMRLCRALIVLASGTSPKGKKFKKVRTFMLCPYPGMSGIGRSNPNKTLTSIERCSTRWYYLQTQTFMESIF